MLFGVFIAHAHAVGLLRLCFDSRRRCITFDPIYGACIEQGLMEMIQMHIPAVPGGWAEHLDRGSQQIRTGTVLPGA